jgi:hypothetical protein
MNVQPTNAHCNNAAVLRENLAQQIVRTNVFLKTGPNVPVVLPAVCAPLLLFVSITSINQHTLLLYCGRPNMQWVLTGNCGNLLLAVPRVLCRSAALKQSKNAFAQQSCVHARRHAGGRQAGRQAGGR